MTDQKNPAAKSDAPSAPATAAPTGRSTKQIAKFDPDSKVTIADLVSKVNELVDKANAKRDRGPESSRDMTDEDASRIMLGDLAKDSHNKAAAILGLSYGQVYSARKGYTFKAIYQKSPKSW